VDTTLDDLQLKQLHTWLGWIKRWAPGDGVQELEVIREEHRDSLYVCLFLVHQQNARNLTQLRPSLIFDRYVSKRSSTSKRS
jgi:hypothetical protein